MAGFFGVDVDVIDDSFHERVLESFFDGMTAPFLVLNFRFPFRFDVFREIDQPLGGVIAAIEQDVFNALA